MPKVTFLPEGLSREVPPGTTLPAELVVMGGYGHSRLKETVFGGVTREMLESMTVPTLMSH